MRLSKLATSLKTLFQIAIFINFVAAANAQNHCATDQIFQKQLAQNQQLKTRHEQIEQQAYQFFSKKQSGNPASLIPHP